MNHEQLQNCKKLLAVGQKVPLNELSFSTWECGTHACYLGHYRRHVPDAIRLDPLYTQPDCIKHFGFSEGQFEEIFIGTLSPENHQAELERRMAILRDIISQGEKELRKGIPEDVRAIFDEPVRQAS